MKNIQNFIDTLTKLNSWNEVEEVALSLSMQDALEIAKWLDVNANLPYYIDNVEIYEEFENDMVDFKVDLAYELLKVAIDKYIDERRLGKAREVFDLLCTNTFLL